MHSTDEELAVLKTEFSHHAEKLDEYEQMRKEIDRLEGNHTHIHVVHTSHFIGHFLWPPCVADAFIIFCSCGFYPLLLFFFFFFFFSSPNLSSGRLDVYHTSTHGVSLVRI